MFLSFPNTFSNPISTLHRFLNTTPHLPHPNPFLLCPQITVISPFCTISPAPRFPFHISNFALFPLSPLSPLHLPAHLHFPLPPTPSLGVYFPDTHWPPTVPTGSLPLRKPLQTPAFRPPEPRPHPISPRLLHPRAPPLALEASMRRGLSLLPFPPPPTVTLRGSLTPSGPAVTLAQRPVGGASQAPDIPPARSPPAQSPPPGNARGG